MGEFKKTEYFINSYYIYLEDETFSVIDILKCKFTTQNLKVGTC